MYQVHSFIFMKENTLSRLLNQVLTYLKKIKLKIMMALFITLILPVYAVGVLISALQQMLGGRYIAKLDVANYRSSLLITLISSLATGIVLFILAKMGLLTTDVVSIINMCLLSLLSLAFVTKWKWECPDAVTALRASSINIVLSTIYWTYLVSFVTKNMPSNNESMIASYVVLVCLLVLIGLFFLNDTKTSLGKEQVIALVFNEYTLAVVIVLFSFWCNQKMNSFSSISDMLIGLLLFVVIPYFLAKKANFKFVQHLLVSFALVYVLLTLLSFLNISTYRDAIVGVAKSFFAITLLALVYEFVAKKKADAIPEKVHAIIEKLDFKKISIILVVIVVLACVKAFVSTSMAQSSQQETTQVSEDTTATESTTASKTQTQVQEQTPIETTPDVEAAAPVQEEVKQLYVINDPDGYTNMRATPGGKIIRKVYKNETFEIITPGDTHSEVKLTDGTTGFIHNSRIVSAD
jgi:hypothetical protein